MKKKYSFLKRGCGLRKETNKIKKSVNRALITHAMCRDACLFQPCGILLGFIAQGVEFGGEDQSGRQGVQGLS